MIIIYIVAVVVVVVAIGIAVAVAVAVGSGMVVDLVRSRRGRSAGVSNEGWNPSFQGCAVFVVELLSVSTKSMIGNVHSLLHIGAVTASIAELLMMIRSPRLLSVEGRVVVDVRAGRARRRGLAVLSVIIWFGHCRSSSGLLIGMRG